jgi:hypothetical protein
MDGILPRQSSDVEHIVQVPVAGESRGMQKLVAEGCRLATGKRVIVGAYMIQSKEN